jgi:SAM-dependent methyltransferase
MNPDHLQYLVCPECEASFSLSVGVELQGRVKEGTLKCTECGTSFSIKNFIPRLLDSETNYADDFGFQWNRHYRTQYDSYSGLKISEERFFNETNWPRNLLGQVILEAGSGSGRFTEQAASTGAMVVTFDYSQAVEANYRNNGALGNVLIVQASIFKMPFPKGSFDKTICIGVLQHTPDPEDAFKQLSGTLKTGGNLVVDAYERLPGFKHWLETKYWVRPITRRISNARLYHFCENWVNFLWPLCKLSYQLTGRRSLSWFLLVADYRGVYPLSEEHLKEWSILDTFDMLAPEYDYPQTVSSVRSWYSKAGFASIDVRRGYNGIQGSGDKA